MAYKLGHLVSGEWTEHHHLPVFHLSESGGRPERIVAGVPSDGGKVFSRLVSAMNPPYLLLYVLHTPRGEGAPGRYQSPELSADEFKNFYAVFSEYLSSDARFDIWAHAPEEGSTVVWDRHNLVYAYGPIELFKAVLEDLRFQEGDPTVPSPHEHYYRPEFDAKAREILEWFKWAPSPLQPEDAQ